MNIARKWLWRIVTHGLVSLMTVAAIFIFYLSRFGEPSCYQQAHIVSQNGRNDKIEINEEICNGLGSTNTTFVNLISGNSGLKQAILTYEQRTGHLEVSWQGDGVINIAIPNGAYVYQKIDRLFGVNILYKDE